MLLSKLEQIELEFNMPFDSLVKDLAKRGYSKKLIAEILMVSPKYFKDLCYTKKLNQYFKSKHKQIHHLPGLHITSH